MHKPHCVGWLLLGISLFGQVTSWKTPTSVRAKYVGPPVIPPFNPTVQCRDCFSHFLKSSLKNFVLGHLCYSTSLFARFYECLPHLKQYIILFFLNLLLKVELASSYSIFAEVVSQFSLLCIWHLLHHIGSILGLNL